MASLISTRSKVVKPKDAATDETSRETPTLTPTYLKMDSTGLAELLMRMEDNRREDQRRMEKNQLRIGGRNAGKTGSSYH